MEFKRSEFGIRFAGDAPEGFPIHLIADYDRRLQTARAVAQWEIGDPAWADMIIRAFLQPIPALRTLEMDVER